MHLRQLEPASAQHRWKTRPKVLRNSKKKQLLWLQLPRVRQCLLPKILPNRCDICSRSDMLFAMRKQRPAIQKEARREVVLRRASPGSLRAVAEAPGSCCKAAVLKCWRASSPQPVYPLQMRRGEYLASREPANGAAPTCLKRASACPIHAADAGGGRAAGCRQHRQAQHRTWLPKRIRAPK